MAKSKTTSYTLARGRTQPYRKTITYLSEQPLLGQDGKPVKGPDGKSIPKMLPDPKRKPVQLVFDVDKDIDLTDEEIGYLENAIKGGYIVPTNRDEKGRQKATTPRDYVPGAEEIIAKLEKQVETLSAKNAELEAKLSEWEELEAGDEEEEEEGEGDE
jgi:hypothetical protein